MRSSFSLPAGLASALLALALPAAAQAAPLATGSPDPLVFPMQALSTVSPLSTVTWTIPGGSGTLGELELAGPNADDFWLVSENCLSFVLASPSTCTAKLRFIPSAAGARTATLRFQSDPTSAVTLQGTGGSLPTGSQGPQGTNGTDGVNGTNGTNGTNGAKGKDGAKGAKGVSVKVAERGKTKVGCKVTSRGSGARIACQFNHRTGRNWLVQLHDSRGALASASGNGKTTMVFLTTRKPRGAMHAFVTEGLNVH